MVAIDLAGHGESGAGRQAWAMSAFGDDVVAVVEKLALPDIVLVGHSMGGDVIVEAALRLPGRVMGLVWVDVYNTLGDTSTHEENEEFVAPFREDFVAHTRGFVRKLVVSGSDPDLVEWVAADMSSAPAEVALGAMEHSINNDGPILAELQALTAPIVEINPDYRSTDIEALQRYGVETVLMPGVGHFLMMEDPETFNRLLAESIVGFRR